MKNKNLAVLFAIILMATPSFSQNVAPANNVPVQFDCLTPADVIGEMRVTTGLAGHRFLLDANGTVTSVTFDCLSRDTVTYGVWRIHGNKLLITTTKALCCGLKFTGSAIFIFLFLPGIEINF